MSKIENWKLLDDGSLFGYVYDDERFNSKTTEFQDGHRIITSLVKIMADDESYAITNSGTRYTLGKKAKEKLI